MNKSMNRLPVIRVLLLFVGLLIVILSLAGCGNATPTPTPDPPEEEETEAPEPTSTPTPTAVVTAEETPTQENLPTLTVDEDDLAGLSIRFVHPWGGAEAQLIQQIATQFSMSNPYDIWVDVEALGGETAVLDALQMGQKSGDLPGLVALHPYQLSSLPEPYFTVNLSNYFTDPGWGFSAEDQADIPQVFIDQMTVDGSLVALPIAPQATVLFVNQTWAEELDFSDAMTTMEDFQALACDATAANYGDIATDNDGTGGWLVNMDTNVLASWYRGFDGELDFESTPSFNNDAGRSAFGFLKSIYDEGCIWFGRKSEPYYYFSNRYAIMYAGSLDQIPLQTSWMDVAGSDDVWGVDGFPGVVDEVMLINGPGLMITADSAENQMAAWLFAKYLLTPEVQAKLAEQMFTLPVRTSAIDLLSDFSDAFPQWGQAAAMIENVEPLPISEAWGYSQWVLQDAVFRILQTDADQTNLILQQLDSMISELEGVEPE